MFYKKELYFLVLNFLCFSLHGSDFDEMRAYHFLHDMDNVSQAHHELVASLPFQSLLQSMLESTCPYQILLTEPAGAAPYICMKSNNAYVYLAGALNECQLTEILNLLVCYQHVLLICDESQQSFFLQHGYQLQPRVELELYSDYCKNQKEIPHNYTVKLIDSLDLFRQCCWYGFMASIYGSAAAFLDKGLGYTLLNESGMPIATAYAVAIGNNACEIGIVTHPDYRGHGYILYVLDRLLQECSDRNLQPIWNCNSENAASYKTAFKKGFTVKRHYAVLKKV